VTHTRPGKLWGIARVQKHNANQEGPKAQDPKVGSASTADQGDPKVRFPGPGPFRYIRQTGPALQTASFVTVVTITPLLCVVALKHLLTAYDLRDLPPLFHALRSHASRVHAPRLSCVSHGQELCRQGSSYIGRHTLLPQQKELSIKLTGDLVHARSHTKDGPLASPESQRTDPIITIFLLIALAVITAAVQRFEHMSAFEAPFWLQWTHKPPH